MGLDMCTFKVKKIEDKEIERLSKLYYEEIRCQVNGFMFVKEYINDMYLIEDLKPFLTRIEAKTENNKIIPILVCGAEEIGYWRKDYELQDQIHDLCDKEIENTGYYTCNVDMVDAMIASGGIYKDITQEDIDDGSIIYWEWY